MKPELRIVDRLIEKIESALQQLIDVVALTARQNERLAAIVSAVVRK